MSSASMTVVKGLSNLPVPELGLPQGREEAVLVAVGHLPGGEDDVDQLLSQGPGQGLFEEAQVLLRLLLGHGPQGLVQIGDDFPAGAVDIAAVNPADGGFLRAEAAAQLAKLFLIHMYLASPAADPPASKF